MLLDDEDDNDVEFDDGDDDLDNDGDGSDDCEDCKPVVIFLYYQSGELDGNLVVQLNWVTALNCTANLTWKKFE